MNVRKIQHVLVTGGAGYIGSTLVEMLLNEGFEVSVLDRFYFGQTLVDIQGNARLHLIRSDVRSFNPDVLNGIDAVLDLAALSNDPAGELDPKKTMEINHLGRARMAELAVKNGVSQYVLASSCSIYGFQEGILDETSPTNPLTTYATANQKAEESALSLANNGTVITILRQATVYGPSRRMRFDLAINGMTLGLYKEGKIPILRDGEQWRPMVHVKDTCRAFILILKSESSKIDGEIFNVGSEEQNFQIFPLAERVAHATGLPFKYEWYGSPDHRSYKVSFKKIEDNLGYKTMHTAEEAAKSIYVGLENGTITDGPTTKTVDWYKDLLYWHNFVNEVTINNELL